LTTSARWSIVCASRSVCDCKLSTENTPTALKRVSIFYFHTTECIQCGYRAVARFLPSPYFEQSVMARVASEAVWLNHRGIQDIGGLYDRVGASFTRNDLCGCTHWKSPISINALLRWAQRAGGDQARNRATNFSARPLHSGASGALARFVYLLKPPPLKEIVKRTLVSVFCEPYFPTIVYL